MVMSLKLFLNSMIYSLRIGKFPVFHLSITNHSIIIM